MNAVGFLCVLLVALPIGLLIGAVFLRASCSVFNRLAGATPGRPRYREGDDDWSDEDSYGRPSGVPEPTIGRAMLIVFVGALVNWVISFAIGMAFGLGGAGAGMKPQNVQIVATVISLPISFAVYAAILMAMLPTTFLRGLLVTLILHVLYFIVAAVIVVVAIAAFGGLAAFK